MSCNLTAPQWMEVIFEVAGDQTYIFDFLSHSIIWNITLNLLVAGNSAVFVLIVKIKRPVSHAYHPPCLP